MESSFFNVILKLTTSNQKISCSTWGISGHLGDLRETNKENNNHLTSSLLYTKQTTSLVCDVAQRAVIGS